MSDAMTALEVLDNLASWAQDDRGRQAAALLLTRSVLRHKLAGADWIDTDGWIDWNLALTQPFSSGEQLLLGIARDLAEGTWSDAAYRLDDDNARAVIDAVQVLFDR